MPNTLLFNPARLMPNTLLFGKQSIPTCIYRTDEYAVILAKWRFLILGDDFIAGTTNQREKANYGCDNKTKSVGDNFHIDTAA